MSDTDKDKNIENENEIECNATQTQSQGEKEKRTSAAVEGTSVNDDVSAKKAKKTTSDVWKYFTKIGKQDGKEKATCNGCGKSFAVGGKQYGTSTLWRHVESCKQTPKYRDIGAMMLDHGGKLRSRQFDYSKYREILAKAIVMHDLPYSYVEYEGVREANLFLNPDCKLPTRKTAVIDVYNLYLKEKANLKRKLEQCPSRVCLTTDCWTSIIGDGYICVTAHFIDDKWNLNSKILTFQHLEPPHTGSVLAKRLYEILEEWGIAKKVFSVTVDNATANDSMQNVLKDMLSLINGLICNGEFLHVRCCAHILNLIVQEGLKVASGAIQKIRQSIRYVRQSEARKIAFKKCVEVVGIRSSMGLKMDVPTRWNSTHAMLESAITYRRAFASLAFKDSDYEPHNPTAQEWSRAEEMCKFLAPFAAITELISGSSYPTSNLYFLQIMKIESLLAEYVGSQDPVIQDMATSMLDKFDKYWSDYSVILSIAIILDPRMKLDIIRYSYSQLEPTLARCNEKVEYIKGKLYDVFNEYKHMGVESSSSSTFPTSSTSFPTAADSFPTAATGSDSISTSNANENLLPPAQAISSQLPPRSTVGIPRHRAGHLSSMAYKDYIKCRRNDIGLIEKSELDFYLEEALLDINMFIDLDILEYWKTNSPRFPCLSRMAGDILSIPITTVASESAFSIGSRVLTKFRSSLLSENVEALICTRNWLLGFPLDDDLSKDNERVRAQEINVSTISHHASNPINIG